MRSGADVELVDAEVHPSAWLEGPLQAGPGLFVAAHAVLGGPPQHRAGGPGALVFGQNCVVREGATVHRGSAAGSGVTRVGDRLFLMAHGHIGHDAELGDDITIANGAMLGGHVRVADRVVVGARAAVHQYVTVGRGAMVAAGAMVSGDVPPWSLVSGDRARVVGVNRVGLQAAGLGDQIDAVRRVLRGGTADASLEAVRDVTAFLASERRRPLCGRHR